MGADYLRTVGLCYIFFAIMFVSNGVINGAGHTLVSTVISLVSQWAVRVPAAWLLSRQMRSVRGVWYAIAISFGVSMLSSLFYYASGRWRRAVVRRRPVPAMPSPADVFGEGTGEV
jgi:Na+-driven multidrug efflux pump